MLMRAQNEGLQFKPPPIAKAARRIAMTFQSDDGSLRGSG